MFKHQENKKNKNIYLKYISKSKNLNKYICNKQLHTVVPARHWLSSSERSLSVTDEQKLTASTQSY